MSNRYLIPCTVTVFLILTASATDFSKYTIIDQDLKNALRTNWVSRFESSKYIHGNVATFGNSITNTRAFWVPFAYNSPGVVPGTNSNSYTIDKDNDLNCATSGYTIDNGIECLIEAMNSLKPEVVVCEYGTNDVNDGEIGTFGNVYRRYIDSILIRGVIPIISTVPPRGGIREGVTLQINDTIKAIAKQKQVVVTDFYQAFMDHTSNNPFTDQWMDAERVHPSGGCALTEMENPQCGYAIRNAVTWHAVNKVYRIIIDNAQPDNEQDVDKTPPSVIVNLTAVQGDLAGTVKLQWTAPMDSGSVISYDLRYSTDPITESNFGNATKYLQVNRPKIAGSTETLLISGLTGGTVYYFAIKSHDGYNLSPISNVVSVTAPIKSAAIKDSITRTAIEDTYLEAGIDASSKWGSNQYIRIKSGGQGVPLVKFNFSSLPFVPDSGILVLTVDNTIDNDLDYSYTVEISGILTQWNESEASYNQPLNGAAWPQNDPQSVFDRSAMTTSQFSGKKGTQVEHRFPLSAKLVNGLQKGTYSGIMIWETSNSYNNCHFSSREGNNPPKIILYSLSSSNVKKKVKKGALQFSRSFSQLVSSSGHITIYRADGERVKEFPTPIDNVEKVLSQIAVRGIYIVSFDDLKGTRISKKFVFQ